MPKQTNEEASTFCSGSIDLPLTTNPVTLVAGGKGVPVVESIRISPGTMTDVLIEFFDPNNTSTTQEIERVRAATETVRLTGLRHRGPDGYGIRAKVVTVASTTVAKVYVDGFYD